MKNIFDIIKGFFISLPIGIAIGVVFILGIYIFSEIVGWMFNLSIFEGIFNLLNDLLIVAISNNETVLICFAVVITYLMVSYNPTKNKK
ncbi:MAG: hypothetical protein ACWGHO_02695 [Candidatus Moraniibacteriota bacterium]